jgi:hypothetical protein
MSLVRVEPAAVTGHGLGGLDRLGVNDRGGRLRRAAGRDPALAAVRRASFRSRRSPVSGSARRRRSARTGSPPASPASRCLLDQVADGVDDIAAAVPGRAAAPALLPRRGGQGGLGDRPLRITHVRRIPRHPCAAADPALAAPARNRQAARRPVHGAAACLPRSLGTRGPNCFPDRHKSGSWARAHSRMRRHAADQPGTSQPEPAGSTQSPQESKCSPA